MACRLLTALVGFWRDPGMGTLVAAGNERCVCAGTNEGSGCVRVWENSSACRAHRIARYAGRSPIPRAGLSG